MKRLCVYFFYDKDGYVDDYIPFMLKNLQPFCTEICFVSNGKINKGKEKISPYAKVILERENRGFDVGAFKEAIYHYGWTKLADFNEVIFMNYTLFGPVYPFDEMFKTMEAKDLDFWGITQHHSVPHDPSGCCKYKTAPAHYQSSFIAIRRSMITSREYQNFMNNLPEIKSYHESIGLYELIFTKDFRDMGFKAELYVDTNDLEGYTWYPLMKMSKYIIHTRKCPVFKVKSFSEPYLSITYDGLGNCTTELYEYLQKHSSYDLNLALEHVIRTANMADLQKLMHYNFILPKDYVIEKEPLRTLKTALILHLYYPDQVQNCLNYALNMPENSDLIITTSNEEIFDSLNKRKSELPFKKIEILKCKNRGKDLSALLIEAAPFINDYDYVCFAHDSEIKKEIFYNITLRHWQKNIENVLISKQYVENILHKFEKEKYLGVLFPPHSWHGFMYETIGNEWGTYFDDTSKLCKKLNLNAILEKAKEPIAPLGTMFWFRPQALKKLFLHKWKYSDFGKFSEENDLYETLKRTIPFAAQDQIYYSSYVQTPDYAANEIDSLHYMLREINKIFLPKYGKVKHVELCGCLDYISPTPFNTVKDAKNLSRLRRKYYIYSLLAALIPGSKGKKLKNKAKGFRLRIKNVNNSLKKKK